MKVSFLMTNTRKSILNEKTTHLFSPCTTAPCFMHLFLPLNISQKKKTFFKKENLFHGAHFKEINISRFVPKDLSSPPGNIFFSFTQKKSGFFFYESKIKEKLSTQEVAWNDEVVMTVIECGLGLGGAATVTGFTVVGEDTWLSSKSRPATSVSHIHR